MPNLDLTKGRIPPRRQGFTLIELLVVMAIISILASILFPVFDRAIEKAHTTQCLSNIKQVQLATMMYSSDYDGWYPPAPYTVTNTDGLTKTLSWPDVLQPYIENYQLFVCPGLSNQKVGYALNYWMVGSGGTNAHRSAEKITYADASEHSGAVSWYMYPFCPKGVTGCQPDPDPDNNPDTVGSQPDPRHNEGANFAYADGHAKWSRVEMKGVSDFAIGWDPGAEPPAQ